MLFTFAVNGQETKLLSPPEGDAVLSYFHQFSESPDGKRVVYTLFNPPDSMEVVIKDLSTGDTTSVARVMGQDRHTGAHPLWVNNHTLIYCSGPEFKIFHHNLRTGEITAFRGGQISDYSPVNGKILYNNNDPEIEEKGIYSIDLQSGEQKQLVDIEEAAKLKPLIGTENAVEFWRFSHPYWSPDGKRILFQIKTSSGKSNAMDDYLFHTDANAEIIHFIGKKPMHVQWWDNNTVFGHDWHDKNDRHMRRYDLQGNVVEELSGPGCHGTVSPDRQWVATESWYKSDPIILFLYRKGDADPTMELFRQPAVVNGIVFWEVRSHIHPSFSRNGKRVYFNGQGSDGKSKVWYSDVSDTVDESQTGSE